MLWVYAYAIGYFLVFCFPLNWATGRVKNRLLMRVNIGGQIGDERERTLETDRRDSP